jgi:hypothetical protein
VRVIKLLTLGLTTCVRSILDILQFANENTDFWNKIDQVSMTNFFSI